MSSPQRNNTSESIGTLPIRSRERVELAHGGGGELMREMITQVFVAGLAQQSLDVERDAAVLDLPDDGRIAFATDSFVVSPLFFPGGDIGTLAVNSTINDLAMVGATPLYLSAAFILEEGLPLLTLDKIVASMRESARATGVRIVTGDTKVVDRGNGDGAFINTTGIGVVDRKHDWGPRRVRPGDAVLVSGDLGRHGIAVLSVREGLEFNTRIESDCAPLIGLVAALIDSEVEVHCLRDLTRGGLASGLIEIAHASSLDIEIDEGRIPIHHQVSAACALMGLDPMYVANEGRMVVFVAPEHADRALEALRSRPLGKSACRIGTVREPGRRVRLRTAIGTTRILDRLNGEKLPRIC